MSRPIKTKEQYEAKQKAYESIVCREVSLDDEESIPGFLRKKRGIIMRLEAEREEDRQRVWNEVKDIPIGGPADKTNK